MKEGVESLGRVRAQGIALVVVVFLAGVLAGVAGDRLLAARRAPEPPPPDMTMLRPLRRGTLPGMFRQLNLTLAQRRRILEILEQGQPQTEGILREMLPRLRAVTDSVHMEIRAVLTEEQATRLDSLLQLMRPRHGPMGQWMPGQGQMRRGPPPPQP